MKKTVIVLTLLLTSFFGLSQEDIEIEESNKNEISTNLLDLVVAGSFNVNYERYLDKNQSLFIGATFFDTFAYFDAGNIKNTNAVSLKAAYIIYFSKKKDHAGFFFYPQARIRTGEVTIEDYYYYYDVSDTPSDYIYTNDTTYDVGSFSLGFGIGHKWVFNDKFTLGINAEIGRVLAGEINTDYLDYVEPRFGVNFGIRF
ncbi:hypothetical protein [Olleya sp. R77988]|uniref:hypothetical protein n=1 Tax=Olleya sp. R77988 TaxID=3093875 RepID=UPI0037C980C0